MKYNLKDEYKKIMNILGLRDPKGRFNLQLAIDNINLLEKELAEEGMIATYRLYVPFTSEHRAKEIAIIRETLEPIPEFAKMIENPSKKTWTKIFRIIEEMKLKYNIN